MNNLINHFLKISFDIAPRPVGPGRGMGFVILIGVVALVVIVMLLVKKH